MSNQHSINRRQLFRMRLPHRDKLNVVFGGLLFKVVEISERGIRIEGTSVPNHNGVCRGEITWNDGRTSEIQGIVGRIDGNELVIVQVEGINMSDIVDEQRRVNRLKIYPVVKGD